MFHNTLEKFDFRGALSCDALRGRREKLSTIGVTKWWMPVGLSFTVQSTRSEGGQVQKKFIHLQELDGKYSNQYVAMLLDNDVACAYRGAKIQK